VLNLRNANIVGGREYEVEFRVCPSERLDFSRLDLNVSEQIQALDKATGQISDQVR
jgi:hypothetical protein